MINYKFITRVSITHHPTIQRFCHFNTTSFHLPWKILITLPLTFKIQIQRESHVSPFTISHPTQGVVFMDYNACHLGIMCLALYNVLKINSNRLVETKTNEKHGQIQYRARDSLGYHSNFFGQCNFSRKISFLYSVYIHFPSLINTNKHVVYWIRY